MSTQSQLVRKLKALLDAKLQEKTSWGRVELSKELDKIFIEVLLSNSEEEEKK